MTSWLRRLPSPSLVHHRSLLVNSYPAVSAAQPRLDFSYYEYPDIARFEEVCAHLLSLPDSKQQEAAAPGRLLLRVPRHRPLRGGARTPRAARDTRVVTGHLRA